MKRRIIVNLSVLMSICFMLGLAGCGSDAEGGEHIGKTSEVEKIQTAHMVLEFPAEYAENLKHEEHIGSERTEEVFYMVHRGVSIELFRICFGDQTAGTPVGYLHMESGAVPVTVQVGDGPMDMDDETENLYFGMMEGMNKVLDCVYRDARFSEHLEFHPGEETEAAMKYWTVELPESITWEESTEGDLYQVNFYGKVASTQIKLYSICIGDEGPGNPLGTMEIDGKSKTVFVKIEGLSQADMMSETERSIVYSMLDTVNDVVQQIVSSKHFSPIDTE